LLVVVAIIALLVTLMFPSLGNMFGVARSVKCTHNLNKIGQGIRLAENQEDRDELQALSWQSILAKYMGGNKLGMICPEYAHQLETSGASEEEEEDPMPLEELAMFRVQKGSTVFWEDMGRGPMVVKLSDDNYHRARNHANQYLGNSSSANNFPRGQFEDGSEDKSRVHWLCLEDHGGDWDFKDVMVKVTLTATGYILEPESGFTGHKNSIWDKLTNEKITDVKSNTVRGSLEPIPISTTGVISSYGMNTAAPYIFDSPGGIVVLDYHWVMADPQDSWSDYRSPVNSSIPTFARHNERINVLFGDGSTKMMNPYSIDPINSHARKSYWTP